MVENWLKTQLTARPLSTRLIVNSRLMIEHRWCYESLAASTELSLLILLAYGIAGRHSKLLWILSTKVVFIPWVVVSHQVTFFFEL